MDTITAVSKLTAWLSCVPTYRLTANSSIAKSGILMCFTIHRWQNVSFLPAFSSLRECLVSSISAIDSRRKSISIARTLAPNKTLKPLLSHSSHQSSVPSFSLAPLSNIGVMLWDRELHSDKGLLIWRRPTARSHSSFEKSGFSLTVLCNDVASLQPKCIYFGADFR